MPGESGIAFAGQARHYIRRPVASSPTIRRWFASGPTIRRRAASGPRSIAGLRPAS